MGLDNLSVEYEPGDPSELWWCNSHHRRAEYVRRRSWSDKPGVVDTSRTCHPKLGGIMIPCRCVDLTGIAEIEECR